MDCVDCVDVSVLDNLITPVPVPEESTIVADKTGVTRDESAAVDACASANANSVLPVFKCATAATPDGSTERVASFTSERDDNSMMASSHGTSGRTIG